MINDSDQDILQHLHRFEVVAKALSAGPKAIRSIGRECRPKLAAATLLKSIRYLEARFGDGDQPIKLIRTAEGKSDDNQLTEDGRRLYQRIGDLLSWRPKAEEMELRVEVSHSLLTSQAMSPAIASFVERIKKRPGPAANLRLSLRTEMDFRRICNELQSGDLTMALTWGIEQRLRLRNQIVSVEIGPAFDVVLISHSQELVDAIAIKESIAPNLSALANHKIIMRAPGNQPFIDLVPPPNLSEGGGWVVVDTIDTVIALVAARIGTYAIVPAIYPVLDRYRQEGQLFWSDPIRPNRDYKGLHLHLFTRATGRGRLPVFAREFVDEITSGLAAFRNRSVWSDARRQSPFGFPKSAEFYTNLKWGYYVDHDRSFDKKGADRPVWRCEDVDIRKSTTAAGGRLSFSGSISNSLGDTFIIDAELFNYLFIIKAYPKPKTETRHSVKTFVSVFPWCSVADGVVCGTWYGDFQGRPTMYATVFSRDELTLEEVCEFSRRGRQHNFLTIDSGVGFQDS